MWQSCMPTYLSTGYCIHYCGKLRKYCTVYFTVFSLRKYCTVHYITLFFYCILGVLRKYCSVCPLPFYWRKYCTADFFNCTLLRKYCTLQYILLFFHYVNTVQYITLLTLFTWRNCRLPSPPQINSLSVCPSVRDITFNFSAENCPGPTDLVKYCLKNVNWCKSRVRYFSKWIRMWWFS